MFCRNMNYVIAVVENSPCKGEGQYNKISGGKVAGAAWKKYTCQNESGKSILEQICTLGMSTLSRISKKPTVCV